jgi:hypothetical protein
MSVQPGQPDRYATELVINQTPPVRTHSLPKLLLQSTTATFLALLEYVLLPIKLDLAFTATKEKGSTANLDTTVTMVTKHVNHGAYTEKAALKLELTMIPCAHLLCLV